MATTARNIHGPRREKRTCPTLAVVLSLMLGWSLAGGCGVKGPPTPLWPPAPLPTVADLSYRVTGRQVTLAWRLPSPLAAKAARQAYFVVRRFRTALDPSPCETCPRVFKTVETIPYVQTDDAVHTLSLTLETGYRYAFTVHIKAGTDVGPDCDPVQFDYPLDGRVPPVEKP